MYKHILTLFLALAIGGVMHVNGQVVTKDGPSFPKFAIKSNLLYDATATFNLGVELGLGRKTSLELPFNYNPWTFQNNRKWQHFLAQPELRFWFCERFNGTFFGIHAHYATYDVGNIPELPIINNSQLYRYKGWLAGGGISIGHSWILSPRLGLEVTVGAGYAYMDYDRYKCEVCGNLLGSHTKHYFGPTKAGFTLIYLIK